MRRTHYYTAVSADGFVADGDGSMDWLTRFPGTPAQRQRFAAFFAGVGAMAMGATTYEWLLDHAGMRDRPDAWREAYGATPCWVFTHREFPAIPGADISFVHGDVAAVHPRILAAAGEKDVWLVGGGSLAGQFADAGLLDRVHLGIAPVTLGDGARVLPHRSATAFRLADVSRDEGFVYVTYDLGPVAA